MKGRSDIVSALQNLNRAKQHFESFCNEHKGSKGANLFKMYINRIDFIFRDLYTNPFLSEQVREGIKAEVNSDAFSVPAISEKIALLRPNEREMVEDVIEQVINGKNLSVNYIN